MIFRFFSAKDYQPALAFPQLWVATVILQPNRSHSLHYLRIFKWFIGQVKNSRSFEDYIRKSRRSQEGIVSLLKPLVLIRKTGPADQYLSKKVLFRMDTTFRIILTFFVSAFVCACGFSVDDTDVGIVFRLHFTQFGVGFVPVPHSVLIVLH